MGSHAYTNTVRDEENGYTITCKFDSLICYQSMALFPFPNIKLILIPIYTNSMLLGQNLILGRLIVAISAFLRSKYACWVR
jgi:hypothetical protein